MPTYSKNPVNGLKMVNGMYSMNTRRGISMRMIGLKQVEEALLKKRKLIQVATMEGLLKIAVHIRGDMEKTPPLIPVDSGNMRARFRINPKAGSPPTKSKAEVFDSVTFGWPNNTKEEYAPYVHEMTQPPYENEINWSRPGSGPKFFEAAIKRNQPKFTTIIGNSIRPVV